MPETTRNKPLRTADDAPPVHVLIVDDEEPLADGFAEALIKQSYICQTANSFTQARQFIEASPPDVLVTDLKLNDDAGDGLELLRLAKSVDPRTEVILMTAYGTVDTCRQALQEGALDYVTKPIDLGELRAVVRRAADRINMARQIRELREQVDEKYGFEGIIGTSAATARIIKMARQVAGSEIPVLLQGESGTGKELLAHAVHNNSDRKSRPFVALNCAGLSESILEDELFGHVKGAFTGAAGDRKGRFEHAHSGTLFLDEIGDMPPSFQAKLLRVLENGEVVRLGSNDPVRVDVRLISATNRDLTKMVQEKHFREDLFFRIKGVTITIPPIRDRREDIPVLIDHFLHLAAARQQVEPPVLTAEARRVLTEFDWPGNVRQLKTTVETMLVLSEGEQLDVGDIPDEVRRGSSGGGGQLSSLVGISIEQAERLLIKNTLALVGGNREQAARILGIGERTLYRKIKEYDLADTGKEE